MIIYKITNNQNNKVYIGQTIRTLEERFRRHKNDALNNVIDTHFARAIRYYGPEAFSAEIIDTAETQEELNEKERFWIHHYNSIEEGYNETDAEFKCGGNTYKNKTPEELAAISEKIRESKMGGKNPHATAIKCKNIHTQEEYHFGSQSEVQAFFNETNHQFVSRRCRGMIKCLYKDAWIFAYEENEYPTDYTEKGKTPKRGTQIKVTDTRSGEEFYFASLRALESSDLPLPNRKICSDILKGLRPQLADYHLEQIQ